MDNRLRQLERNWASEQSVETLKAYLTESLRCESPLPMLRLMTANNAKCKRDEFPINHFTKIDGGIYMDLGAEVDATFLEWRPKALRFDETGKGEVSYKADSKLFKEIEKEANGRRGHHAMFGPEFIVLVGDDIMTLYFGTKSAKRTITEAGGSQLLGYTKTLYARHCHTSRFDWYSIGFK